MYRRLYFLLPDAEHARAVARELESRGVARDGIRIIAGEGARADGVPVRSEMPAGDPAERLENRLWVGNLGLFFAALVALAILLLTAGPGYWLLVPVAIMALSFAAGMEFAKRVPDVHLSEFTDALRHRELLLTVDVPAGRVAEVERLVHRGHPEAVDGGVGWSAPLLHL